MPIYSYKFSGREVLAANSGSITIPTDATIRGSVTTGVTPPAGTSGGYFNIGNSLTANYSQFSFYGRDDQDADAFGIVSIGANPEEGISLYASTYNNTNISSIYVKKGTINITTPSASLAGTFSISGSMQVTGSINIKDLVVLAPRTTTPTSPATGSLIMSASGTSGMSLFVFTGAGGAGGGWGRVTLGA
jgi:hypothetical protein